MGKETREKEIELGRLAAKEAKKLRRIDEVAKEFKREMEEEGDVKRLTKTEHIKKNVEKNKRREKKNK